MRHAALLAVTLLSLCGCDRGSRTDESQTSPTTQADPTSAPQIAGTPAPGNDVPAPPGDPPADRPMPAPLPPNVSLPSGAAIDTSAPLPGGKHTVLALFADESDQQELVRRFTEELAGHGWRPKGEPESGVNDGLSADFENDAELLNVSVYAGDSGPGLRAMLQLRPKAKR